MPNNRAKEKEKKTEKTAQTLVFTGFSAKIGGQKRMSYKTPADMQDMDNIMPNIVRAKKKDCRKAHSP